MHELSIAQALVVELERVAAAENAVAVTRVTVAVGSLSGVEPEALRLVFPFAAEDTLAQGAALVLERAPASVSCLDCGATVVADLPTPVCGTCGSMNLRVEAGRQLLIRSVELDCPGTA